MPGNPYDEAMEKLVGQAPPVQPPSLTAPTFDPEQPVESRADKAMRDMLNVRQVVIGQTMDEITAITPEQGARIVQLAERYYVPVAAIQQDFDTFDKQAQRDDADYLSMVKDTPVTASWMIQVPPRAAAVQPDVPRLQHVERILTWGQRLDPQLGQLDPAVGRGIESSLGNKFAFQEALGELRGDSVQAARGRAGRELSARAREAYGPSMSLWNIRSFTDLGHYLHDLAGEQIPIMAEQMASAWAGGKTAAVATGGNPEAIKFGAALGAFMPSYVAAVGEIQQSIKSASGEKAVAPEVAFIGGVPVAALDAALPGLALGTVLTRTFRRTMSEKAAKVAANTVARKFFDMPIPKTYLRAAGTSFRTEAITEGLQRAFTDVATSIGADTPMDWTATAWGVLEEGIGGGIIGGGFGVVEQRAERSAERKYAKVALAQAKINRLAAVGQTLQAAQSLETLPSAVESFVKSALREDQHVYVSPSRWVAYFTSQQIDPAEAATLLTGDPQALATALRLKQDLVIPYEKFAIRIAAVPERWAALGADVRVGDPLEMTGREAQVVVEARIATAAAAAVAAEATAEAEAAAPVPDPHAEDRARYIAQAMRAGAPREVAELQATMHFAIAANMERDAHATPGSLPSTYPFDITTTQAGPLPGLSPSAVPVAGVAPEIREPGDGTLPPPHAQTADPGGVPLQPVDALTPTEEGAAAPAGEVALAQPDAAAAPAGEVELEGAPTELNQEGLDLVRGLSRVAPFLTDAERGRVTKRHLAERLVERFDALPTDADFIAAAKAGRAKRGWYREATQALIDVFGPVDAPRFAALLAALSPRVEVRDNLANAVGVWAVWDAAGRPTSRKAIKQALVAGTRGEGAASVLPSWVNNAVRALSATDPTKIVLSGPKVHSFYKNLIGDVQEVTNDAWMAAFALVDQALFGGSLNVAGTDPGKVPSYLAMNAKIRRVAQRLSAETGETWTPSEVQETVWSWAKTIYELAESENVTAEEIVRRGGLSDAAIRDTPDIATLLTTETNVRSILEGAGYGNDLTALERTFAARRATGADPDAEGAARAGTAAAPTPTLGLLRSARRLDRLRADRAAAKAATLAANRAPTDLFQGPTDPAAAARKAELEQLATDEAMGVEFPEDGPSTFPDGTHAIVCTNCAERIIALNNGEGEVYGWEEGTNPTSVVAGPTMGARLDEGQGHDFAIIDGRYLVDAWAKNVEGSSDRAVFDMRDPADRADIARLYGDPSSWMRRDASAPGGWVSEVPPALTAPTAITLFQGAAAPAAPAPVFFQKVIRAIEASQQGRATGAEWKAMLQNKAAKISVSEGEYEIARVADLDDATVYTKDELLTYLRANAIVVKDVTLSANQVTQREIDREAERLQEKFIDQRVDEYDPDLDGDYYVAPEARYNEEQEQWEAFIIGGGDERDVGGWYDTEEEAEAAAQEAADDRNDRARADLANDYRSQLYDEYPISDFEEQARARLQADEDATQYAEWQEKGPARDYREVFLTVPNLPAAPVPPAPVITVEKRGARTPLGMVSYDVFVDGEPLMNPPGAAQPRSGVVFATPADRPEAENEALALEIATTTITDKQKRDAQPPSWVDGHEAYDDIENPIVRLRFNIRDTARGPMMFLEEVQPPQEDSGNFQKMPLLFQQNWREIAFKWALRYAADHNLAGVAWTTGEMQSARYTLAKDVHSIDWRWSEENDGTRYVDVRLKNVEVPVHIIVDGTGRVLGAKGMRGADRWEGAPLEAVIGKEVAARILAAQSGTLTGKGLTIGGEGLRRLYDKDFPNVVNKLPLVKKHAQRVESVDIPMPNPKRVYEGPDYTVAQLRAAIEAIRGGPGLSNFAARLLTDVADNMQTLGTTFAEEFPTHDIDTPRFQDDAARLLGGKLVPVPQTQPVPAVMMTPALADAVQGGVNLFQQASDAYTTTPAFQTWFGNSQVVEADGSPQRVFHATSSTFTEFDPARVNVEGDLGGAFYFSNNPEDVGENYAGQGADLDQKIDLAAERIEQELVDSAEGFETMDEAAREQLHARAVQQARIEVGVEHGGLTMPVYLRIEQPAIIGGDNETQLTLEQPYDEEGEPDGEPTGTLVDFIAGLRDEARQYDDGDVEAVIEKLFDAANYESISLGEAMAILHKDEQFGYFRDYDHDKLMSHEIVRAALERAGFDGIIDHTVDVKFGSQRRIGRGMAGMDPDTVHYAVFSQTQIKSALGNRGTFDARRPSILEQPPGPGPADELAPEHPRAKINISDDRTKFLLTLFAKGDVTSLLHEGSHYFFEVMGDTVDRLRAMDPATLSDQQTRFIQRYDGMLRELGVTTRAEVTGKEHERFADLYESYLHSGIAPSKEMRGMFAEFRRWFNAIYQTLKPKIEISPEVRDFFDRMIASDEAIAEVRAESAVGPMFTDARSAGMSDAVFAQYRDAIQEASTQAREQLDKKLLRDAQRQQTRAWRARRLEVKDQVTAEVHQQPVYVALAQFQHGTLPNGQPIVTDDGSAPSRLSRQAIVRDYGVPMLRSLPKPAVYTTAPALDPATAAELFGFASGEALLTALSQAVPMATAIEAETDRRMVQERGGLLADDDALLDAARAAHATEAREVIARAELRALAKLRAAAAPHVRQATADVRREQAYERRWLEAEARLRIAISEGRKQLQIDVLRDEVDRLKAQASTGPAQIRAALPPAKLIRDSAVARVAGTKIRDLQPHLFWAAAQRANKTAIDAAARQDYEIAVEAQQQYLVNIALYREAVKQLDEVERRVEAAKDLATTAARQRLGLADQSFLDQVDGILDRYEFATVSRVVLDRRAKIANWVAAMQGENLPIDLPDMVLDDARRTNYRELTVDELVEVTDALKHIVHLARERTTTLKVEKGRSIFAMASELSASIYANTTRRQPPKQHVKLRGPKEERAHKIAALYASMRKMSSLAYEMDGNVAGGPMATAIVFPMNEAAATEATMMTDAVVRLGGIVEKAYPGREKSQLGEKVDLPLLGQSLPKITRLMVALNWGNAGNKQRLLDGRGWSEAQAQQILDTLDARDWQFVQDVWDMLDSYWLEIKAKEERVRGIAPERVVPLPFTTRFGEMRGGYMPIVPDERASARAQQNVDVESANFERHAAYVNATTKRGHTKARAEKNDLPLLLTDSVITKHLQQVIHDLSHHEALIDVGRILGHKLVQEAIYDTYGDQVYQQFRTGIRDVALGPIPPATQMERSLGHLRIGGTVAVLGWNVGTWFLQPLGLTQSFQRIGVKWVARGMGKWLRDPAHMEGTMAWIMDVSPTMRARWATKDRDLHEITTQLGVQTGKLSGWIDEALRTTSFDRFTKQKLVDSYFSGIALTQRIADVPTWLGQYEKSMAEGEPEDRAIQIADQAVKDAQGGGQMVDLAGVQRGTPALKLFTAFYSFGITTFNLAAESHARARRRRAKGDARAIPAAMGRLIWDYFLLYTLPATLGYAMMSVIRASKKDENEPWWVTLARENIAYMMNSVFGLREFAGAIRGFRDYSGPSGGRFFATGYDLLTQVGQLMTIDEEGIGLDEEQFDSGLAKTLFDTAGIIWGFPTSQPWKTLSGGVAIIEGRTENPGALVVGQPFDEVSE